MIICLAAAGWFSCGGSVVPGNAAPDVERPPMDRLVVHGGYAVSHHGSLLRSHNPDLSLVPASVLKIATALASLHTLGPGYRFETGFYRYQDNLYIKGSGDPFLVSEEIAIIADRLGESGVDSVRDLVLDATAFNLVGSAHGAGDSVNPYDALNGALAVNFNTVKVEVSATGEVRSAEPQTPTLPIMRDLARGLPPGTRRINVTAAGRGEAAALRYCGELFSAIFKARGITVRGGIRRAATPDGLIPVYQHRSRRAVKDILRPLLRYSNNFIANQLFLACGMYEHEPPATWEKGRRTLKEFLHDSLGLTGGEIVMVEGSGLSRRNRATPRAMLRVLEEFLPFAYFLPEENERYIKSGTLTGVYAYAGYFHRERQLLPFVIILNQKENHRDRLLSLLAGQTRQVLAR